MKNKVRIINNCPSCGAILTRITDQLFCSNSECGATMGKKVQHYAKAMKIKGLGEKTIEKLDIITIEDIYFLTETQMIDKLGVKIGTKLFNEIQFSKVTTLSKLLPALSISLIGNTAARKVAQVVQDLQGITLDTCKKAGLGDKASSNLVRWLDENYSVYENLPLEFKSEVASQPTKSQNIKVCITGKLDDHSSRDSASTYLREKGITVVTGVSKALDYLINEDNKPSSKLSKANSYGIPIVTIKHLIEEIIK